MNLKLLILLSLKDNFSHYKENYTSYKTLYQTLKTYSQSSIRASINSLLRSGNLEKIVKNGKAHFSLTLKGFKALSQRFLGPYQGLKGHWDRKWRIVIFDIPENKKRERVKLRKILKKCHYGRIVNSVYVSPFDTLPSTLKIIKENLGDISTLFVFQASFPYKNLENNQKIALQAFRLEELAKRYLDWIRKTKKIKKTAAGKQEIDILISYYDMILGLDPALPQELLPENWPLMKSWQIFIGLIGSA